ncbi:MAG: hypothetical protein HYZ89_05855 [Candidatus Omnitrophica bacterium]|nr:hypothetical protein [Candidatus Omnitrophota bacterium]
MSNATRCSVSWKRWVWLLCWFVSLGGSGTTLAAQQPQPAPARQAARKAAQRQDRIGRLVALGKQQLIAENFRTAYQIFQTAHRLDPRHPEANFYLALTRLLSWTMRRTHDFKALGFQGPAGQPLRPADFNPFRFMAQAPQMLQLPGRLSNGEEIQRQLARDPLAELRQSSWELDQIPANFTSVLAIRNPLTGTPTVEIDDADVALLRAAVHASLAKGLLTQLYHVEAEVNETVARFRTDQPPAQAADQALRAYPAFLHLRDPAQAGKAKQELLAAIEAYLAADALLRAETDSQEDDLFTFSRLPEDVRKEHAFREALTELRASLTGLSDPAWTLTLDQFLHLGDFFDRPPDLRLLDSGRGLQGALVSYLGYQSERALANLRKASVTFSEPVDPTARFGIPWNRPLPEIDYGDLLGIQAGLESLHAAVAILASYDADLSVSNVAAAATNSFDLDTNLLNPRPNLLRLQNPSRLIEAKLHGLWALRAALDTSAYLRSSDDADQRDDVFRLEERLAQVEARWRPQIEELRSSLQTVIDPDPDRIGDEFRLNLNPLFDLPLNPRALLPRFDGLDPLPRTLPDPTLGGILPDATQEDWSR